MNDFQINEDGGAVRTGRVNLSKKADNEISGNVIPRINRSYVERALAPLDDMKACSSKGTTPYVPSAGRQRGACIEY